MVWKLSDASMALLREGIGLYKSLRGELKDMVPFFPLGFSRVGDRQLAYGLRGENRAYLSVFCPGGDAAEIPLDGLGRAVTAARAIYPASGDCEYRLEGGALRVKMPGENCARLFELDLEAR